MNRQPYNKCYISNLYLWSVTLLCRVSDISNTVSVRQNLVWISAAPQLNNSQNRWLAEITMETQCIVLIQCSKNPTQFHVFIQRMNGMLSISYWNVAPLHGWIPSVRLPTEWYFKRQWHYSGTNMPVNPYTMTLSPFILNKNSTSINTSQPCVPW